MNSVFVKLGLFVVLLSCTGCVVAPYDPPPPRYYGYGPAYPWAGNVNVDIGRGGGGGWHGGGGGWHR